MKNIEIPGLGTVVIGSNIDELLDVINEAKAKAATTDKEHEAMLHNKVIDLCNMVVKHSIKEGKSIEDFMAENCFDDLDSHPCVACNADAFTSFTPDEIKSIGEQNVIDIIKAVISFHNKHTAYHTNRLHSMIKDVEGMICFAKSKDEPVLNYNNMTKEQLIELLKSKK